MPNKPQPPRPEQPSSFLPDHSPLPEGEAAVQESKTQQEALRAHAPEPTETPLCATVDDIHGEEIPRDIHGDITPEARAAIDEVLGFHLEFDDDGLPTEAALASLIAHGPDGIRVGNEIFLATKLATEEGRINQEEELKRFEMFTKMTWDEEIKEGDRRKRDRQEIYAALLPYDLPGNPVGQKVAGWMRERMKYMDISYNGKIATRKPRGIPAPFEGEALQELSDIIAAADDREYEAIFPDLSRKELAIIFNDPNITRLQQSVRSPQPPEEIAQNAVRLQQYLESLPTSIGGLKYLWLSRPTSILRYMAMEAKTDPKIAAALAKVDYSDNSFLYPDYRALVTREEEKQKSLPRMILAGILRGLRRFFDGE